MKLIIAEKPSVARTIAALVGADKKQDGYLEGPEYLVTWAVGHLIGLCEPGEYCKEWEKWDLSALPIIPQKWQTKVLPDTAKQYRIVEGLLNRNDVDMIINAGDAGQEGELIQRHIYNKAMRTKKPIKRLWVSSLTSEAILDGLKAMKDSSEYDNLYYAGLARAMADWLIGDNASRLYTLLYHAKPPLASGRVQSPTLSEIVARHLSIVNFKPEDYYTLTINAEGIKALWFKKEGNLKSFKTLPEAKAIEAKVTGKQARVISYKTEKKRESRPRLHNLASLQQEGSRIYKYSAQDVLKAAQSLYEKKFSTYPRTDSVCITDDMIPEVKAVVGCLSRNITYGSVAQHVIKTGLNIDKRIVDASKVSDHPALLPTRKVEKADLSQLSQTELNVYHLIISRLLLALSPDYIYNHSTVILEAEQETFRASGSVPIQKGFRALRDVLFPPKKGSDKKEDEENLLASAPPDMAEGKEYTIRETEIKKGKTAPPKEYTDGTLIAKMENPFSDINIEGDEKAIQESLAGRGLGTPATRGTIIESLIKRGYICRDKSFLIPTERGIKMVQYVLPDFLKKPDMTAEWEYKLRLISKGEYPPQEFLNEIKRIITELVEKERSAETRSTAFESSDSRAAKEELGICPVCGGKVYKQEFSKDGKKKAFYKCENNRKEGGSCNFILWGDDRFIHAVTGAALKEGSVKSLLKNKKAKVTAKKKDGSGTYPCYIVLKGFEDGRAQWGTEWVREKKKD